jgi:predicted nucleotide-binding protein
MEDEDLLELLDRVRTKLHQTVSNATHWASARDDYVLTINAELQRLADAGIDVKEWIIPESELKPSQGFRESPSGQHVPVRRMDYERFLEFVSPMLSFLDRETARRHAVAGKSKTEEVSLPEDPTEVWVIYGHDEEFRRTIFDLLRSVGLKPIEFDTAVKRSGSGAPYILDLVLNEIRKAPAIVSLLTPDDYAELREELRADPKDAEEHKDAGHQPRPNVIFETGVALAALRDRTILVKKGRQREITDMGGLHEVRWDGSVRKRNDLVGRLDAMGSPVDRSGSDWLGQT